MNDWPPPSIDDAPAVPPAAAVATPWWRRNLAQGLLVAWVVGGVVALVVIGVSAARDDDRDAAATLPTASAAPPTTTRDTPADITIGSTTGTDRTPTTEPLVRSAPPVPPLPESTAPTEPRATPGTTTIVVTLPPTTVVATLPPPSPPTTQPTVAIEIRFDATGDDAQNLNDEWVRFTNAGGQALDLTNWIVRDDGFAHAHVFDPLRLEPGATVTLYSGCGDPTGSERFFCTSDAEVWNNDGDVVSLFDGSGLLVSQRRG